MNRIVARLIQALVTEPAPDPSAVRQGLTVRRLGWGRYQYSGLPTVMRGRQRRRYDPTDPLDRLLCGPADAYLASTAPPAPGPARQLHSVS